MPPKYDFDFLENKEPLKELPNFRIVKCCGNCRYFTYARNRQRRSYCRLFEVMQRAKGLYKKGGETYKKDMDTGNWRKVHTTTVCDAHRIRSHSHVNARITEWTGIVFDGRGEQDIV